MANQIKTLWDQRVPLRQIYEAQGDQSSPKLLQDSPKTGPHGTRLPHG